MSNQYTKKHQAEQAAKQAEQAAKSLRLAVVLRIRRNDGREDVQSMVIPAMEPGESFRIDVTPSVQVQVG